MAFYRKPLTHKEDGFVLITGMLFLVVLTVLVVSLMRTSILEERMIGYSRDWNVAFQSAESALRGAETEIYFGTRIVGQTGFESSCSSAGLCLPNQCTDTSPTGDCLPIWVDLATKQDDQGWIRGEESGKSVKYAGSIVGVAAQPRYIIEVLDSGKDITGTGGRGSSANAKYVYRVTAVGFGASVDTRVVLQAMYRFL